VFRDSFTGAGDFTRRPAMASLLAFLDSDLTTNYVVIFDDIKRLARDVGAHLKLRIAFDLRKAKVECPNFNFEDTPEGHYVETIIAAGAELERGQNQRQVIQKMKARLEKGYWTFVAPVGYRMEKHPLHGQILTRFEPEAIVVKEALEGFAFGRFENRVEVQKFLQTKSFRGLDEMNLESVKKLLTRSVYAGYVEYKEWDVSRRIGHHEPIITLDTFEKIQDKLNGKIKVYKRKDTSVEFPLRGFVLCSHCLGPLTASWTTSRGKRHPYYHCKNKKCALKWKSIKRDEIENQFETVLRSIKPKEKTLNLTREILLDVWTKRLKNIEGLKKDNEDNLDAVRAKIRMFLERITRTENESLIQTYEKEIEKLNKEEQLIESQTQVMRGSSPEFGTALDITFNFLKNPYVYWKKEDIASKHLVLKLVFNDRLQYERGVGFGTANLALPLRVFELSELNDSSMVVCH
jgi:hypothetical protein